MSTKTTFQTAMKYLSCKDCIHVRPDLSGIVKDKFYFARCVKSGTIDLTNGKIEYDYASIVRKFSCGEENPKWFIFHNSSNEK